MKVTIQEHGGCFGFNLEPETMQDQVLLARIARNATKEVRGIYVNAHTDLTMTATVVLGKRKKPESSLT